MVAQMRFGGGRRRWHVLAYARGIYASLDCLCEIRDHPFLAAPPRPYMGGKVS
jgi:hypothetical protein